MAAVIGTDIEGVQIVGTDASPIALGATGGATDVGTWTHNRGRRASMVQVVDATNRAPVTPASVVPTQPSVNSIVLTNTTGGALNVLAIVWWSFASPMKNADAAASVFVLS